MGCVFPILDSVCVSVWPRWGQKPTPQNREPVNGHTQLLCLLEAPLFVFPCCLRGVQRSGTLQGVRSPRGVSEAKGFTLQHQRARTSVRAALARHALTEHVIKTASCRVLHPWDIRHVPLLLEGEGKLEGEEAEECRAWHRFPTGFSAENVVRVSHAPPAHCCHTDSRGCQTDSQLKQGKLSPGRKRPARHCPGLVGPGSDLVTWLLLRSF